MEGKEWLTPGHTEDCMCESCLVGALEKACVDGYLQKLRRKDTKETVWLNSDLPIPPSCEPWEPI